MEKFSFDLTPRVLILLSRIFLWTWNIKSFSRVASRVYKPEERWVSIWHGSEGSISCFQGWALFAFRPKIFYYSTSSNKLELGQLSFLGMATSVGAIFFLTLGGFHGCCLDSDWLSCPFLALTKILTLLAKNGSMVFYLSSNSPPAVISSAGLLYFFAPVSVSRVLKEIDIVQKKVVILVKSSNELLKNESFLIGSWL